MFLRDFSCGVMLRETGGLKGEQLFPLAHLDRELEEAFRGSRLME